ncbi:MAG: glycosyltransferase [Planctomycetes bacterium]|nr:glycosyltransferase [Planctomycetota bacterium]
MLDTALREWARTRLTEIGWADVVVGIPCFNSERTIAHVMKAASEGMSKYFPGRALILLVSDGGSTDYTREVAQKTKLARGVDKVVTIYRGVPGKGTSLRCIFEAALLLEAKACAVVDSDLRSITPEWIRALVSPIFEQGYDFVSPFYIRHKHDATITNNIARGLIQALYGRRLRQPIGGEFGLSPKLMKTLTAEDVWETDVAKFGIDIWMTTIAICEGFKICETFLGSKIHDAKDPSSSLSPMFTQVVGTMFAMMKKYERAWRAVKGSDPVPMIGGASLAEPEPVDVSLESLVLRFREGMDHFGTLWMGIVGAERFAELSALEAREPEAFEFPMDLWVHVVYSFAVAYNRWKGDRRQLVDMMVPIYFARVAGFVAQSRRLTTPEAEALIERQAQRFEELKGDFIARWDSGEGTTVRPAAPPARSDGAAPGPGAPEPQAAPVPPPVPGP